MSGEILIYRMGAFGDTLLLAPLLGRLREPRPGVRVTLAANPAYAAPLLDAGLADEVLDGGARPFHLLYDGRPSEGDALSRLIRRHDACVFYTADRSGELARRLRSSRLAKCRIHPPFPPEGESVHVCAWMTRAWPGLSASAPGGMKLTPSESSLAEADKVLKKQGVRPSRFFVIHPGGGGARKWPPPGVLAEMGREMERETGHQPVVAEGPADSAPVLEFQEFWGAPLPVLRETPPVLLGALLSKSSGYVGGDSGVSHLASLCAPRASVLYGPHSDMRVWRPVGSRTRCVPWEAERGSAGRRASAPLRRPQPRMFASLPQRGDPESPFHDQ